MNLTRRNFLQKSSIIAGSCCLPKLSHAQTSLPNILFIIADDLGWNDIGYHGSEINTPNLDSLKATGIELDRFYVYPTCSPSRASLFTGRDQVSTGIINPVDRNTPGPALDEPFMPQNLQIAGYQTWLVGKWHLGAQEGYLPNDRGFDYFYGFQGGAIDYISHTQEETNKTDWYRNNELIKEDGYSTYLLRDDAIQKIKSRDKNKPFFLNLAFNAPHTPLVSPPDTEDKYPAIQDPNRNTFANMVDALDESIGQIISTLDEEGIRDNTLIFFFSDNGANSNLGGGDNTPLRGAKGSVFEGGIRTPAIISWPEVLPSGIISEQVVSVIDIYPTIVNAIGITAEETKPFDGKNRFEQLKGVTEQSLPENLLFLSQQNESDDILKAIIDGEWKLVETPIATRLYKIFEDPNEENNLAHQNTDIVEALRLKIEELENKETSVNSWIHLR